MKLFNDKKDQKISIGEAVNGAINAIKLRQNVTDIVGDAMIGTGIGLLAYTYLVDGFIIRKRDGSIASGTFATMKDLVAMGLVLGGAGILACNKIQDELGVLSEIASIHSDLVFDYVSSGDEDEDDDEVDDE